MIVSILPAVTAEDEENDMYMTRFMDEGRQRLDDEVAIMPIGGFGPYGVSCSPFWQAVKLLKVLP